MTLAHWPKVPLQDLLVRRLDWVQLDPDIEYRQVTVKLWGGGVALRRIVKGSGIAATSQVRVKTGQFILSRIDARHGAFGLVPESLNGAVVSQDFPVFETNKERLLPEFLDWMSKTTWFVQLCRTASEGSTNRVRIKEDRFLLHAVPLPPIEEQRRIVAQLADVTVRIAAQARAAGFIESELNATLRGQFRKVLAGAPQVYLGEVAPLVRRVLQIDADTTYTELGVRSFYKGTFHRRSIKGAEFTWQKLFYIRQGDLIFSNLMAWEQAIAIAKQEDDGCVGNHRMLTCEVDPSRCLPSFLLYYFTTEGGFSQIVGASPGSIARNKTLSAEELPGIIVPLPSLAAQQRFELLQSKALAARTSNAEVSTELGHLLPAMLSRLIRNNF